MSRDDISEYVATQLSKRSENKEEPNEAETLLLACGYQELLRKVISQAQVYAEGDGSKKILPYHIESAMESLLDR